MNTRLQDEKFHPLYEGYPVLVRLTSGTDILAVVYHSEEDDRLMLEQPISIVYEPIEDSETTKNSHQVDRVRVRFERWVLLSDADFYPIYMEHMLTMAPLTPSMAESYTQWAKNLYQLTANIKEPETPQQSTESSTMPAVLPDGSTPEEVVQTYLDFFLHNFKPKGKPN